VVSNLDLLGLHLIPLFEVPLEIVLVSLARVAFAILRTQVAVLLVPCEVH
jgi:hypothetical protein